MKRHIIVLSGLVVFCALGVLSAQTSEKSSEEEWRQTLRYGIEEEILHVLDNIRTYKITSLNGELVKVLGESLNTGIRVAILDYFTELKYNGGEAIALAILENWEEEEVKLINASMIYLNAIGSFKDLEILKILVDHENKNIAALAIKYLGLSHQEGIGAFLLEKYQQDDFEEDLKPNIILAWGELRYSPAVEMLLGIVEDTAQKKILRMYACDALGKIGDTRAIPVLEVVLSETDALIKAYAAAALGNFNQPGVVDVLIQACKDTNPQVRIAAIKSLAEMKKPESLDVLIYKANKDPVLKVRLEAIAALGKLGLPAGFTLLRELYESELQILDVRAQAVATLIEYDLAQTFASIKRVVEKELVKPMTKGKIIELSAKYLVEVKAGALEEIYALFLTSDNALVRMYAVRGIGFNHFSGLKPKLETISTKDPAAGVRKAALAVLEAW